MDYGHLYTWHGVKSGNGQRGVQGERLALIPLSSELWEKPFPPHPQFSPKKNLLKGREEKTGSLWGTSFMDHHSRPSRDLE